MALAPPTHIMNELYKILTETTERCRYPIGVLTTEHRDTWYQARKKLEQGKQTCYVPHTHKHTHTRLCVCVCIASCFVGKTRFSSIFVIVLFVYGLQGSLDQEWDWKGGIAILRFIPCCCWGYVSLASTKAYWIAFFHCLAHYQSSKFNFPLILSTTR